MTRKEALSDSANRSIFYFLKNKIYWILLPLVIGLVGYFYIRVVDTQMLGFTHDDGVYAIVGKALSEGKGFTLLHVPGQPGQIKYPFIYPFILSLVWLIQPHFPQNVPAMNYVTIAFTLLSCWLIYLYLRQCQKFPGWLALLIIILTTSNFFFIYFFSSVMSEAPYLFLSLLTLWYIHRAQKKHPDYFPVQTIVILILLSSVMTLTRVTGITLMAAIGAWLLLNRQWKNALIYGIGVFLTGVLPWMLWVKFQTPVVNELNFPLVNAYSNYGLEFAHNYMSRNYLEDLKTDLTSLIAKLQEDMFPLLPNFFKVYPKLKAQEAFFTAFNIGGLVLSYLLLGYYLLQLISTTLKSFKQGRFNGTVFSIPGLYLFFYILLITLWNYEDQMARFLTVVLPVLWMYFFKPLVPMLPELGQRWREIRWKSWTAIIFSLFCCAVAIWPVSNSYRTVFISRNQHWVESGKYRWMWKEYQSVFSWIRSNLPKDAKLSAASDVVFYLYTNRPTFYTFYASLHFKNGHPLKSSYPLLMNSLDHYQIRYLVAEPHMQARTIRFPVNLVAKNLMALYPERFQHIHASPRGAINIYKILPRKSH